MNNATGFDDITNDFDATGTAVHNPAEVTEPTFTETCKKCSGKGTVTFGYSFVRTGTCFACKGVGSFTRKTSPEQRAAARAARANREVKKAQQTHEAGAAWLEANPAVAAWLKGNSSDFASSLTNAVYQWGRLTEGQTAAVLRCIERDAERAAEKVAREAAAPVVEVAALEEAFGKALAAGKVRVSITLGALKIKPAKAHEGVLYVTEGEQYLGKVMGNRFLKVRECSEGQAAHVVALLADPKAALEAYGKDTGICGICNRTLTDPVSIANGIGPICANKFGW